MTRRYEGERTLMRIFIAESDRAMDGPHRGKPLHRVLLLTLAERGCAGATVLRGMEGFGASARVHTTRLLDLSLDLPLVLEVIETDEKIQELLPELDALIGGALITLEKVRVILYQPPDAPEDERSRHRTEGLRAVDEGGSPR
jgi:uncharacterized protein